MSRYYQRSSDFRPDGVERSVSCFCYLSMGLIGLLYIIISGKNQPSDFFRFHFIQSILLGAFFFLFSFTAGISNNILGGVLSLVHAPFTGDVLTCVGRFWWLLGCLMCILLVYGGVFALLGKYADIPIVSAMVRNNIKR